MIAPCVSCGCSIDVSLTALADRSLAPSCNTCSDDVRREIRLGSLMWPCDYMGGWWFDRQKKSWRYFPQSYVITISGQVQGAIKPGHKVGCDCVMCILDAVAVEHALLNS